MSDVLRQGRTEFTGVPHKVLITAKSVANSPDALQMMRQAGLEVVVANGPQSFDEEWRIGQVRDASALVFAMEPVSARLLDAAPRLKVIARPGVGYDTVDLEAATRNGVIVTIAPGTNDQSVADFTIGLMLEASRGISQAAASVRQGGWDRVVGREIWGKTMAVVGLGRIGRNVVKRARGFDMRVLVVSPHPDTDFARRHEVEFVSLENALRDADFLSLHAPLTVQTRNLIDASALAMMRRGAYLINTSRGGLIDEQALADAVLSGHLAGAAVDVLCVQGEGSPSPLIDVPGILVTPHMATCTREAQERVSMSVARSIIDALRGLRPEHVVNPAALGAA